MTKKQKRRAQQELAKEKWDQFVGHFWETDWDPKLQPRLVRLIEQYLGLRRRR